MKKQFHCLLCERLYAEMEEAEVCERSHDKKNAVPTRRDTRDGFTGYCLKCAKRLTRCGIPFSGEFQCRLCGAINIYENSQQPSRIKA